MRALLAFAAILLFGVWGALVVLQLVPVEEGQQVIAGTNLARVARPDDLMAELRIAEPPWEKEGLDDYLPAATAAGENERPSAASNSSGLH